MIFHSRLKKSPPQQGLLPVFLMLFLMSMSVSLHAAPYQPFEAKYKTYAKGVSFGEMTMTLSRGENYSLETFTKATGIASMFTKKTIREINHFSIKDGLVTSINYQYLEKDRDTIKQKALLFNAKTAAIHVKNNTDTSVIKTKQHTIDRLAVQFQIMEHLKQGQHHGNIQFFHKNKKTVHFELLEKKKEKYFEKEMDVLLVAEKDLNNKTRRTVTTYAPELNYLPVEIKQYKNDKLVIRMVIDQYTKN
ncbi:MAG: DUF3108 domain-containing protein [Gammaproteobacteria bacterium]|nr:DUF3108 domain-containing protein [Gammaproteobacteria bacterium]